LHPRRDRPWVISWEEALQQLDAYPWATMVPLKVHPTFRSKVAEAVNQRIGSGDRRATENWRSVLAEHA